MKNLEQAPIKIERYKYFGVVRDSFCSLYVWSKENRVVIKALPQIENGKSNGTSPNIGAEKLCKQVVSEFNLNLKKLTWIHYYDTKEGAPFDQTTFIDFKIQKSFWSKDFRVTDAQFNHINSSSIEDCLLGNLHFNSKHTFS